MHQHKTSGRTEITPDMLCWGSNTRGFRSSLTQTISYTSHSYATNIYMIVKMYFSSSANYVSKQYDSQVVMNNIHLLQDHSGNIAVDRQSIVFGC